LYFVSLRIHLVSFAESFCDALLDYTSGGATNSHSGNRAFRALVKDHQKRYLLAKKRDKPSVASIVVELIRDTNHQGQVRWVDIGDERAREKTCRKYYILYGSSCRVLTETLLVNNGYFPFILDRDISHFNHYLCILIRRSLT
jgi:hypothetical protein